jgi:hypothetical protein
MMRPVFLEDLRTGMTRLLSVVSAAAGSIGEPFGFRQPARIFHATAMRSSHA